MTDILRDRRKRMAQEGQRVALATVVAVERSARAGTPAPGLAVNERGEGSRPAR